RPDLLACFDELEPETWFDSAGTSERAASPAGAGWHDDDTEGIPVGLPPLTEEVDPRAPVAEARGAFDLRVDEPAPPALIETPRPVADVRRTPDTVEEPVAEAPAPPPEPELDLG